MQQNIFVHVYSSPDITVKSNISITVESSALYQVNIESKTQPHSLQVYMKELETSCQSSELRLAPKLVYEKQLGSDDP